MPTVCTRSLTGSPPVGYSSCTGQVNSVEPPAPILYWGENKDGTASTRLLVVMSEDWQSCFTCRLEERQRREEEERIGLSDHGCRPGLAPVGHLSCLLRCISWEDSTSIMLACLSEDEPLGDVQRGRLGHETATFVRHLHYGHLVESPVGRAMARNVIGLDCHLYCERRGARWTRLAPCNDVRLAYWTISTR